MAGLDRSLSHSRSPSHSGPRLAVVLCLAVWLLAVPLAAEAPAASVSASLHSFSYRADPGERNEIWKGGLRVRDPGAREIRISSPCRREGNEVECCRLVGAREVQCELRGGERSGIPQGSDSVYAGDGDDRLDVGLNAHEDTATGWCAVDLGAGRDDLRLRYAGCGATVIATDGEPDVIDCAGNTVHGPEEARRRGEREDSYLVLQVDQQDRLENCPGYRPPPPGDQPGGGPGSPPDSAPDRDTSPPRPRLSGPRAQARDAVLRRGLGVGCSIGEPATCVVGASISRRDARSLGLRVSARGPRITVGGARTDLPWRRGGRRALLVKLSAGIHRAMARRPRSRPRMLVTAVARDRAGNTASTRIWVSIGR